MKHKIDPRVDCVFKAILTSDGNGRLLVHFLNAMLLGELQRPIESVDILNPYLAVADTDPWSTSGSWGSTYPIRSISRCGFILVPSAIVGL